MTATATELLVVTFKLGYQEYGLPVEEVLQVVQVPALLALAGAPPYLRGLLNLHGAHLPVLDTRALVGAPTTEALTNQVVIAGRGLPEVGLLVDQTNEVRSMTTEPFSALPANLIAPILRSILRSDDHSALLLDLPALLALTPNATAGTAS